MVNFVIIVAYVIVSIVSVYNAVNMVTTLKLKLK